MIIVENIFLTVIFWIVGIPVKRPTTPRLFIFYNLFVYLVSLTNCAFFLYQIIGLGDNNISLYIEFERSLTGLFQLILIHFYRSQWIQLNSIINQYITSEEIKMVKKLSSKFAILLTALLSAEFYSWVMCGTVDELYHFFYGEVWSISFLSKFILTYITIICRTLIVHGVIYASVIFYLCSYYKLHLLYNKFYQKVSNQSSNTSVPKQFSTLSTKHSLKELPCDYQLFHLRIGWTRLSSIKRSLESSFHALPAVWFGRYLFESFLCLFRVNQTIQGTAFTWFYLVDKFTLFTNVTILLIVLINMVDTITLNDLKLSNCILDLSNKSLDNIINYPDINIHKNRAIFEDILIKSEFSRAPCVPITIFRMVEIRRAFIPVYINTLIPMVVMALDFAENYSSQA